MNKCGLCDTTLSNLSLQEALEVNAEFRENFPKSYKNDSSPVRICERCYQALRDLNLPQEWEEEEHGET